MKGCQNVKYSLSENKKAGIHNDSRFFIGMSSVELTVQY